MPVPCSHVPNLLPSQACLTLTGLAHCNPELTAWNGISSIFCPCIIRNLQELLYIAILYLFHIMNASHLSTVAAKATSGQDGQKLSSLASGICESFNDAKDVRKTTSTVPDYDSDLLCAGTWATKEQHPETIIPLGEGSKQPVTFPIGVLTPHSSKICAATPMYSPSGYT